MSKIFIIVGFLLMIVACSGQWDTYPEREIKSENTLQTIDIGDMLNVDVFEEANLSGDYPVLADGTIHIPLIGSILVEDKTIDAASRDIAQKFIDQGYLVDPQLTLSVAQSRMVKIMGEIRGTGEYSYTEGMTILGLVAKSGGFSYRANQESFDIVRKQMDGDKIEKIIEGSLSTRLAPGDIVRVKERFF